MRRIVNGLKWLINQQLQTPSVFLHAVMIRMADSQIDWVWRAAMTFLGADWPPEMKEMEV
jgi:hypothetical protein